MLEKHSQRSRGFGFVWFADEASREAAIAKLHGTNLEGRKISVTKAIPQSQTAPGTPADALRRGQTVPRDQGRVRRNGGSGSDRGRDHRYDRGASGSYRRDYSRDRDDRGRDSYRDSYDRDGYSYRGSGSYDRGYDRGYNGSSSGGGGGGSYRPGYGYDPPSDTYSRDYDRSYSSYNDRRPFDVYSGSSDKYYEPYVPRSDSSYAARLPPSRYEPAAAPSYYGIGGGGGGGAPASRHVYGADRHERTERSSGPYDRPAY